VPLRPTARVEGTSRSWWCTTGRTELRSVSSGRDLNGRPPDACVGRSTGNRRCSGPRRTKCRTGQPGFAPGSVHGKWGGRPDSNRRRGDHGPECLPLHHGHSGDGRARTGGLSPDKRALWPSELRPHLESRGWDSNPRSRAHEAREDNRSSTALLDLAGRTRTCDLRLPGPVGWPASPTARRRTSLMSLGLMR
jgi:hypothetical protein